MEQNLFGNKNPILEVKQSLSKDKKWIISRTIITDIKSVNYIKKVME